MTRRNVIIIGSGRRVQTAPLPVLQQLREDFELRRIYAKKEKSLEVGGVHYGVAALSSVTAADLQNIDLIIMAVSKPAVPAVLAKLANFDVSKTDLLIDTPVVLLKHFRHMKLLKAFRNAWVAEDCTELPFLDAVRATVAKGMIGEVKGATFFNSAYAYHGIATLKTILGPAHVVRARRTAEGDHKWKRVYQFSNHTTGTVFEPRDYSIGKITIEGTRGSISDFDDNSKTNSIRLAPVIQANHCVGFRAGDITTNLTAQETPLMAGGDPNLSVTARMEAMKRVGFLRLLKKIQNSLGAYPVDEALDDMVIDYLLEKTGRYRSTPLTNVRGGFAKFTFSMMSRIVGR
ncbi:MAG: hypothetical protein ACKVS6_02765 [Planctomycetota bacterium]